MGITGKKKKKKKKKKTQSFNCIQFFFKQHKSACFKCNRPM